MRLGRDDVVITASIAEGVGVHWHHRGKYILDLRLMSFGPSAPRPGTKIEPMKQLAQKVDAALGS